MIWLDRRDVEAFHAVLIAEFGGLAGIRDAGAPLNLVAHGKSSIFELAASHAFAIARNHPFVDGNKRTALVASFTFLELNGWEVKAAETDAVLVFLDLAAGKLSQDALMQWLESHSVKKRKSRK